MHLCTGWYFKTINMMFSIIFDDYSLSNWTLQQTQATFYVGGLTNFSSLILICRIRIWSQKIFSTCHFPVKWVRKFKKAVFGGPDSMHLKWHMWATYTKKQKILSPSLLGPGATENSFFELSVHFTGKRHVEIFFLTSDSDYTYQKKKS